MVWSCRAGRVIAEGWESFHHYVILRRPAPVYFSIFKCLLRIHVCDFCLSPVRHRWEKNTFRLVCQGQCWFKVRKREGSLRLAVTGGQNLPPWGSFSPWWQPWEQGHSTCPWLFRVKPLFCLAHRVWILFYFFFWTVRLITHQHWSVQSSSVRES